MRLGDKFVPFVETALVKTAESMTLLPEKIGPPPVRILPSRGKAPPRLWVVLLQG